MKKYVKDIEVNAKFFDSMGFSESNTSLSETKKRKSTFENYDKRFIYSCLPKESESLNSFTNRSNNVLCNKFNISKKRRKFSPWVMSNYVKSDISSFRQDYWFSVVYNVTREKLATPQVTIMQGCSKKWGSWGVKNLRRWIHCKM